MLYALGGGMGHLTRAVALARAAVARSKEKGQRHPPTQICLLTNSPFAAALPIDAELGDGHRIVSLRPTLGRDETATRVTDHLQSSDFDVLVVDTFPRGLGGELFKLLPDLTCHKILVHRDLNPRYIDQFGLSDLVNQFDRILVPGERAPFDSLSHAVWTAPWLIRDDHELLSPAESRQLLEVESDSLPVVAVIGCGKDAEVAQMRLLARQLEDQFQSVATIRFVTPNFDGAADHSGNSSSGVKSISIWPFFQAIRGVCLIVGSGGYNIVQEARATGTRLIGLPRRRLYDNQRRRLDSYGIAAEVGDIQRQVSDALASYSESPLRSNASYQNGVHKAVETIESLFVRD